MADALVLAADDRTDGALRSEAGQLGTHTGPQRATGRQLAPNGPQRLPHRQTQQHPPYSRLRPVPEELPTVLLLLLLLGTFLLGGEHERRISHDAALVVGLVPLVNHLHPVLALLTMSHTLTPPPTRNAALPQNSSDTTSWAFIEGADEAGAVLDAAHGAFPRYGQPSFCLAQDDVGERPGPAVLGQLAGAAPDDVGLDPSGDPYEAAACGERMWAASSSYRYQSVSARPCTRLTTSPHAARP